MGFGFLSGFGIRFSGFIAEAPSSGGFMLSLLDRRKEESHQDRYDGDDDEAGATEG